MTDIVMTTAQEPDGAPRVASLDILRGIAILGILFMNINDMGASMYASFGDFRVIGWNAGDQVAWWLREVFANGTARCLLEMLFGVGMVILTERAADTIGAAAAPTGRGQRVRRWLFGPWSVMKPYYWRNLVLFAFGLIHIFILLWPGDILHTYGLAALVAFLFRRLGPKTLLGIGLLLALLQFGGGGYGYLTVPGQRAEAARLEAVKAHGGVLTKDQAKTLKDAQDGRQKRAERKAKEAKDVAAENQARTGTFMTWAKAQWQFIFDLEAKGLEIAFVWEAAGTMLVGAALFKWGIIQGDRSRRFYAILLVICYAIGLGSRAAGAFTQMQFDNSPSIIWPMGEFARLATTVGHIALVQLMLMTAAGTRFLRPFIAAGRTALSIYVAQTLVCLWVLYPPFALGLYGQQGWLALMLTALAVNAVLLLAANWYVGQYKIAPVEWAWRSIIAGRRLPIRRAAPGQPSGVPATG